MKKAKVIYDISILANGFMKTSARSGVFFVAYNILVELSKRKDISLFLYVDDKFSSAVGFIKKNLGLKHYKIYGYSFLKGMSLLRNNLRHNRIKRKSRFVKAVLNLFRIILSIFLNIFSRFQKEAKCENCDIFLSPIFKIPDKIRRNNRIKRFTISYDMIPFIFPEYYPEVQAGNFWFKGLINSINKDDYFFTISDYSKKDLIKYNPNVDEQKVTTTYLATSDNFYYCCDKKKIAQVLDKYKIPQGIKYIFSLCTLEPRKNLIHSAKSFVKTIEKYKIDDLYFVLGGGHWAEFINLLEQEINGFDKYKDRIIKIGYVDDEDLSPLYSGSMCFVYPSLYEGFGLPPLEAMKCGTPVITSNTSSLPEVVGDAGIMVDPKSEKQLISAIYKLYKNENLRKELIKKGLKRAKLFTWEKTVEKMVEKFKEVLRG